MRFLLNMNLPRLIGRLLTEAGHPSRHAGDLGLARADDAEIVEVAKASGEVILTHDLDYGHILAFSGAREPSVVLFRARNTQPRRLFRLLVQNLSQVEHALKDGAIVVIEEGGLRVRPLPIALEGDRAQMEAGER